MRGKVNIIVFVTYFVLCTSSDLVLSTSVTNQTLTRRKDDETSVTGWIRLKWDSGEVLTLSPCDRNVAIFPKENIFLSYDGFRSTTGSQPIYLQDESILQGAENEVTSFTFSHKNVVLAIGGSVFTKKLEISSGWLHRSVGIESHVSKLHAASCCHKEQWCRELNKYVVAFDDTKHSNIVYFSKDSGFTFSKLSFSQDFYGVLQGLNINYPHWAVTSVVRNGKLDKMAQVIATRFSDIQYDFIAVPFYTNGSSFEVYPISGSSSLFIWDGSILYHSFNGGQTVEKVIFLGTKSSPKLGENEFILQIESSHNGEFLVLTNVGNLFYGKESFKSRCQLINPGGRKLGSSASVVLQGNGILSILEELPISRPGLLLSWREFNIYELLLQVKNEPCPIESTNDFFGTIPTLYLDRDENMIFETTLISKTWTRADYLIITTNPELVDVATEIVEEDYPSKGVTRTRMRTVVQQQGPHSFNSQSIGLADVRLVASEGNNILGCTTKAEQMKHFVVGCPATKSIRIRIDKQMEDCDLFKNFSYVIRKSQFDPSFMEGTNGVTWQDKEVKYDYNKYGCPMRTHISSTFKPTIDLFDGDRRMGELKSDFVMFELNGVHDYTYSMTVQRAHCLGNSQSWISMMKNQSEERRSPFTAWNNRNYKDCHQTYFPLDGSFSQSPPYEVLNSNQDNQIVWRTKAEIFIFQVIVVDPAISFCDLRTEFAIFVEGGSKLTDIPSLLVASISVGASMILLYFSFTTLVYGRKIRVNRQYGKEQLEQLDLNQYKEELPKGTFLNPIQKKPL